jgi:hypothetical protein
MAEQREAAAQRPMTIPEAIDAALWLRGMSEPILSSDRARRIIETLLSALEASPCYFKGARHGIPTATFLAYDMAAHHALHEWAYAAQMHGAPREKYEWGHRLASEWKRRPDCKWPD